MTLEELRAVAEIVEKLTNRYRDQEAAHKAALTEIRASFVARAGADEKLIEGYRRQIVSLGAANDRLNDLLRVERLARRDEVAALQERLTEPMSKRALPVAVGGYLRRLTGFNTTPSGEVARVTLVDADDPSRVEYEVMRPNGQKGRWSAKSCEPCDPPATIKREPTIGDTVRLVTHPERAKVAEHLQLALQWPWIDRWGVVGQTGKVVAGCRYIPGAVAVATDIYAHWPLSCVEVVAEANHDTEAGKAAEEAALETESVAEEIKVGDVVEVFQKTGNCTFETDIGTRGTVLQLDDSCVDTAPLDGYLSPKGNHVALCDVRKVTT